MTGLIQDCPYLYQAGFFYTTCSCNCMFVKNTKGMVMKSGNSGRKK